ncbi:hypothetical protein [Streptomyces sp. S.PB5]|uniref:hypothetical protein n=1 Tax=Streptomyces sp. S.PB5 TaxID=3020844 RepID=UPI0025B22589|nr:hypothetical protein [Streptomyces sp. S.PB5]MDN3024940.1 hypothetical protein [Streptomyces sp. S.PB5]
MTRVVAVITESVVKCLELLGPVAGQAVEALRQELEGTPRLGVLRCARGGQEVYKTRLERREGMPGLAVAYLYTLQPPPPAVAIITVTPDDVGDGDI